MDISTFNLVPQELMLALVLIFFLCLFQAPEPQAHFGSTTSAQELLATTPSALTL
jgi:hypothetical protein